MERILQQRQQQVIKYKKYFSSSRLNYTGLLIVVLLIPSLFLGWKMSTNKWVEKTAAQLTELATVAFFTYFRRQVMSMFL